MSYLMLPDGVPDFQKAVISLWFRVPQAAIDKAAAAYKGDGSPLDGVVPLVVFGKQGLGQQPYRDTPEQVLSGIQTGWTPVGLSSTQTTDVPPPTNYFEDGDTRCLAHGTVSAFCTVVQTENLDAYYVPTDPGYSYTTVVTTSSAGDSPPTSPSFIGLSCYGASPTLYANFETNKKASVANYAFNKTVKPGPEQATPGGYFGFDQGTRTTTGCSIPFGLLLPFYDIVETGSIDPNAGAPPGTSTGDPVESYNDISDITLSSTGAIYSDQISITPDQWHHVLVSVELKTIQTHGRGDDSYSGTIADYVDSAAKIFVAVDDTNYTGWDLTSRWTEGDPNDVITDDAEAVAGSRSGTEDNPAVAEYTLDSPTVPSGGQPLGLPATSDYVDSIYKVELAEFLMFTGVTLDTGVEKNRRLFITAPDKDGVQTPVNQSPLYVPFNKEAVGDSPTWQPGADSAAYISTGSDPSAVPSSNQILGTAAVDFTKCSFNWMMGRNLGTAKSKPVTTGEIKAYMPDPKLGSGS